MSCHRDINIATPIDSYQTMRGGYRQNAGRKKGFAAKNAEEARRVLSEMVMGDIEPIGRALINKAKKGDVTAARELFDRAFGKVPQATVDLVQQKPIPIIGFDPVFTARRDKVINEYLNQGK